MLLTTINNKIKKKTDKTSILILCQFKICVGEMIKVIFQDGSEMIVKKVRALIERLCLGRD